MLSKPMTLILPLALALAIPARAETDFARDILPIFESKCLECHSTVKGKPKGGLRLDTAEGIAHGSKTGRIVAGGDPDNSILMHVVSVPADDLDLMPPEGKGSPLTPEQQGLVRSWIAEGAKFGEWKSTDAAAAIAHAGMAVKPAPAKSEGAPAAPRPAPAKPRPAPPAPEKSVEGAARQIDKLVEANYAAQNIKPNPMADDATFVRRVYLDAIGRIPTYLETEEFLQSRSSNKRAELVNRLLGSEGYVSRQYDFWADLLRVQSKFRQVNAANYQDWIRESIKNEKPYTQFVRELLTADGHIYENGASGYYLRDQGMPLDNMANTVQVFLGTRLTCAQCHNHPFDKWTQKEFYEMAAFTFGVQTQKKAERGERQKYQAIAQQMDIDNNVKQAARRLVQKARYGFVSDDPARKLRLPDNYKYEDAAPKSVVAPKAIFGGPSSEGGVGNRMAYADWMTSPENTRFTLVIANRLWRQAMGRGLIEPVDDLKDDTVASNPELLDFLAELMKSVGYNQKSFLRVVYNTKTYQREASAPPESADDVYHFPGPLLRRMSAEQIWDSVMGLIVPNIDSRQGKRNVAPGETMAEIERLNSMTPEELLKLAEEIANRRYKGRAPKPGAAPEKIGEAPMMDAEPAPAPAPPERPMRAKKKKGALSSADEAPAAMQFVLAAGGKGAAKPGKPGKPGKPARPGKMAPEDRAALRRQAVKERRVPEFPANFVRASELQQPAPAGHFLQQFGQSDRETIEASNTTVTVPQILTLLNGPAYAELAKPHSALNLNLRAVGSSPAEQAAALFLSIYNRYPTQAELKLASDTIAADPRQGPQDLVWALLNTQQFIFIR